MQDSLVKLANPAYRFGAPSVALGPPSANLADSLTPVTRSADLRDALTTAVTRAPMPRRSRWLRAPAKSVRLRSLRGRPPRFARAQTFWGDRMLVTPPEPLSVQLYLYGYYEEGCTRFLLEQLREGMAFLDVGAHYGYFTLLGSILVGRGGSVHAFEPTESTYRVLTRNVAGRANVTTNRTAVWSSACELDLHQFDTAASMFNSVFAPRSAGVSGGRIVKVPAVSLDQYVAEHRLKPNFIKIDAESAELQVIQGLADETLPQHRPALTVEVGDASPQQPVSSHDLLKHICDTYGYTPFEYAAGTVRPHRLRESYDYGNILLKPSQD